MFFLFNEDLIPIKSLQVAADIGNLSASVARDSLNISLKFRNKRENIIQFRFSHYDSVFNGHRRNKGWLLYLIWKAQHNYNVLMGIRNN